MLMVIIRDQEEEVSDSRPHQAGILDMPWFPVESMKASADQSKYLPPFTFTVWPVI